MSTSPSKSLQPVAPVIACTDVYARYGRITVVSGISLAVVPGEMLAILGANGAGKSSLLGAIAGTVSGNGRIDVNGSLISSLPSHRRAVSGVSLVPEQRRNIFAAMSVKENIDLGLRLLPASEREEQRSFIMELFPILKERQTAGAGMLSGGEQQMLAISLALGRKPSVMIFDEPTQGLAPAVFDTLQHAFGALKQRGLAMILAEQNVPFAARVADRYLILSQGSVVREGRGSDLANPEEIAAVFLGSK